MQTIPVEQLPIAKVFVDFDRFEDLANMALISRLRYVLASLELWPADAFRAIDEDQDGVITKKEVHLAFRRFGIDKMPGMDPSALQSQVDALFKLVDPDDTEKLTLDQFKSALELDDQEERPMLGLDLSNPRPSSVGIEDGSLAVPVEAYSRVEEPTVTPSIPLGTIVGPHIKKAASLQRAMCTTDLASGQFFISWKRHHSFKKIWDWPGSGTEKPVAIWRPTHVPDAVDMPRSSMRRDRRSSAGVREACAPIVQRIVFGDVIARGVSNPADMKPFYLLEVSEKSESSGIDARRIELAMFVRFFFPYPKKFIKVCQKPRRGETKELHIWKPVPPSDAFVAMGMVATSTATEPFAEEIGVHCLPKWWAERTSRKNQVQIWHDREAAAFYLASADEAGEGGVPVRFAVTGQSAGEPPVEVLEFVNMNFHAELPDEARGHA